MDLDPPASRRSSQRLRVVLASQSPARLRVLRQAGLDPEVIVSGFNERSIVDPVPSRLAARLAEQKGTTVVAKLDGDYALIACDSVLEFEGRAHGKPGTREIAVERWQRMRGHEGILHTGHYVAVQRGQRFTEAVRVGSTVVRFADLTDEEIVAYADTGEPLGVAGGFTIDGRGGAFVTSVVGDPYNIIGISLPLVRQMIIDTGTPWHGLWL